MTRSRPAAGTLGRLLALVLWSLLVWPTPLLGVVPSGDRRVADTLTASDSRALPSRAYGGLTELDVPFVAQGPLLCGGAAVAMVQRFWGETGVYASDYSDWVREDEGGIRTSDLRSAVAARGYDAGIVRDDPGAAFEALEAGMPPVLLLTGGRPAMHYVVLVAARGDRVWIHDPNFGPSRPLSRAELMRRWEGSDFWFLLATPDPSTPPSSLDSTAASASVAKAHATSGTVSPTTTGAMGATASGSVSGVPTQASASEPDPKLDSALVDLRGGRYREAVRHAREATAAGPISPLASRVVASALYLAGEDVDALDHWNAVGEPEIDLVRIRGTRAVRYHEIARVLGLAPRELLTGRDLSLARRKLSEVPGLRAARLSYSPIPNGDVEVRAAVVEHRPAPTPLTLGLTAVRGLAVSEAALSFGPLLPAGERWSLSGRWHPAQRAIGMEVSSPAAPLPGVLTVGIDWRREWFHSDGSTDPSSEERSRGWARLAEWIAPALRVGGGVALERWTSGGLRASAGIDAAFAPFDDRLWLTGSAEAWSGEGHRYGRLDLDLDARVVDGRNTSLDLRLGGSVLSETAPKIVWPGAGLGRVRDRLLRAHRLSRDGAIGGATLAPRLFAGTVEYARFERFGPARLGGMIFADLARAWRSGEAPRGSGRSPEEASAWLDPGVGLFLEVDGRRAETSLAHGNEGWVWSFRVMAVGR